MREGIKADSIVRRNQEIVSADLDGDTVVMSISTEKYYHLGPTGGAIWSLIEKPVTVRAIVKSLTDQYEVGEERCLQETLTFLNEIYDQGLVEQEV